ncbi:TonB family protein [Paraburkholderia sp. 1N]|uniref:TonB family protein n=1 Tax=Paraburkholderia solitsugae TaxID=2675748 RepID=A0ABX2BT69_9BURK|nr:TonB family protein [Paraburkholderia solitsugae]NPT43956.1 TonB family protein [Paraburkholderia solitsugae]
MATVPATGDVQEQTRLFPAAALALIAEVLLLGGAFALLTHQSHVPAEPASTLLTLAAPVPSPAPAPAPAPAPKPVAAAPKPEVPQVRPVVPVHRVAHVTPPRPTPVPTPMPAATPAPALPSATPSEAPPAPRPPPPQPAQAPAAPTASFEGALRAAIQAALRYPESARMAGMSGRTRVAFQYRDGVVSDASVVVSSGIGLLDRAALAAVRDAAYPRPEPAFVGKTLSEQLWVTFNLDTHE